VYKPLTELDYKIRGEYLKPINPFYDPGSLDPPLDHKQIERLEKLIFKDIETAIKQSRSSRNLNTKIKDNVHTKKVLDEQMKFIEDDGCNRIPKG